jgi:hypothetical protein
MDEAYLHYIWQFQRFDLSRLCCADGTPLVVLHPGYPNRDAGPDFLQAKVRMGEILWTGSVEIHVAAADWFRHGHQADPAYSNVILHVVWQADDRPALRCDGSAIPVFELAPRVDPLQLQRYQDYIGGGAEILCRTFLPGVSTLKIIEQFDRALAARLEQKAGTVRAELESAAGDWEETAYRLLARSFGLRINSDPFYRLARSLPLRLLRKCAGRTRAVEALLFGHAGLLPETPADGYPADLASEYRHLVHKFRMEPSGLERHHWKYARTRPAGFPSLRLAQFAGLAGQFDLLFDRMLGEGPVSEVLTLLRTRPSEYWTRHYDFGKPAPMPLGGLGTDSLRVVLINTWAPLLACMAAERDDRRFMDRALEILQELRAENNRITRLWKEAGLRLASSFDSQAALQLYRGWCRPRHCLNCAIGLNILR